MAERALEVIWMLISQMMGWNEINTFVKMRITETGSLALKHMFSKFYSLLRLLGKIHIKRL